MLEFAIFYDTLLIYDEYLEKATWRPYHSPLHHALNSQEKSFLSSLLSNCVLIRPITSI